MIRYVDAHCHVGQYEDPVGALTAARAAGVTTIAVTESPEEFRRLRTRLGSQPGVRVALGAHPLKAASLRNQLPRFRRLLLETEWVGEVGLDYSSRGSATRSHQISLLEGILEMPAVREKVVSVHSRGAERDAIAMLNAAKVVAILHWWTGPAPLIDVAVEAGMWFSVNEAMCSSERARASLVRIPPERMLSETDGPFGKAGRRPSSPKDVPRVVRSLAKIWAKGDEETAQLLWNNMVTLHGSVVRSGGGPSVDG